MAYRNGRDRDFRPVGGSLGQVDNKQSDDRHRQAQIRQSQYDHSNEGYRPSNYETDFPETRQNQNSRLENRAHTSQISERTPALAPHRSPYSLHPNPL